MDRLLNFMKINKKTIFAFILGAFIFSGISVSAAIFIKANEVSYTPYGGSSTDVQTALDDLYAGLGGGGNGTIDSPQIMFFKQSTANSTSSTSTYSFVVPKDIDSAYILTCGSSGNTSVFSGYKVESKTAGTEVITNSTSGLGQLIVHIKNLKKDDIVYLTATDSAWGHPADNIALFIVANNLGVNEISTASTELSSTFVVPANVKRCVSIISLGGATVTKSSVTVNNSNALVRRLVGETDLLNVIDNLSEGDEITLTGNCTANHSGKRIWLFY